MCSPARAPPPTCRPFIQGATAFLPRRAASAWVTTGGVACGPPHVPGAAAWAATPDLPRCPPHVDPLPSPRRASDWAITGRLFSAHLSSPAHQNMSASHWKSLRCSFRKLKQPMLPCSTAETSDGELDAAQSSQTNDFPTGFNFKSNGPVRRRLCTQHPDFPNPDSATAVQSCKKHKAYISEHSRLLQRRLVESSSSANNKDASTSHVSIPTSVHAQITQALALIAGQHSSDRPDIVDRVFHMKLHLFINDITKNEFLVQLLQLYTQLNFRSVVFHMSILYCG